jgi:hypothetical protein
VLDGLDVLSRRSPDGGQVHEGLISVVVEEREGTIRPLPRLYLSTAPIFAARDIDSVQVSLRNLVLAITKAATREPVYLLHGCELDGHKGIYAGNPFNRSKYLRTLAQLGVNLTPHPYLRLTPEGGFQPADRGRFQPSFILLGDSGKEDGVFLERGGKLLYRIASRRLGVLGKEELGALARTIEGLDGVGADDPRDAVAALQQ